MRRLQPILVAATVTMTGCSHVIAVYTPVEMQVVDRGANFIDRALSHSYSNRESFFSYNISTFGGRIPIWLVGEQANHRVAIQGPVRAWAYLRGQGCESTGERSCAYRRVLRMIVNRVETERRLVTLHFTLAPDAAKGCATCVDVRLEIGDKVTP